jgi:uncharacterized damage-inducible protein DinB
MSAEDQLLDTWEIHCRITLYLLDGVAAEAFSGESKTKGRGVAEQFAHIHNVRLMWLKASAPELLEGLDKIEKERATDRDNLRRSLESSGKAIGALLKTGIEVGKVKGFKPHPAAFMGYLIAHESYHHGEIGLILAQSGHPLDKKIAYGMWEWGSR